VRELEVAAAPSSALGVELAVYRRAAGYTQAQFAELTEYSRSTIANVETGRQHVARDFWERADRILRTGGVLATGYDETETAARRQLRAAARGVSTTRQARTWRLHSDAEPDVSATGKADGDVAPAPATPMSFWPADQEPPWPPPQGQPRRIFPCRQMRRLPVIAQARDLGKTHGGSAWETLPGSPACAST
jgi:transcriptional regulator with XRE-family HTH domain